MSSLRPSQFAKEQMSGHDPLAVSPWMQKENRAKYAYTPTIIPKYPSKPPPTSLLYRKFVGSSQKSDYVFERKLGEGTFGEVHQGVHIRSQTPVAIKRFIVHNNEEGMPITSVREVKILKACEHKNLLSLSDTISVRGDKSGKRGEVYMVTPYMDHDLSGLIDNPNVQFSLPQIKCYAKQLLEGLAHLHEKKIIHRDLKVANLLVNNKGILKIADFGLSRYSLAAEDLTLCVVTRWYRPPEILLGAKNYSFPIDLWGVGCILAQMLTSEPLLPGKDDIGQLSLIFELCGAPTDETMPGWRNLPSASSINPGLGSHSRIRERLRGQDAHAIDLIERFLTLDPNKRITAKDALDHPFFSSPPLPAHPSCLPVLPSSHEMDNQGSRAERRPLPYDPYRRPQAKVSPTCHLNGASQQRHHNSRADDYLHGQRADNRNHRSGRRASRERYSKASGSRGPSDNHNSHRNHSYKDGNRHRSGGSHNRRR